MGSERREYQATEFWAVAGTVALWLADRYFGGSLLDQVHLAEISDAKAQVLALAAELRGEGGGTTLLVVAGLVVYVGRKLEKIITRHRVG